MPTAAELYAEAEKLKDTGESEAAIAKLQELLAETPDHSLAHSALAVLYTRTGQHEQAIEHALKTCELEPNDPFSFTALSVTYQRAYRGTNNLEFIQKAEDAMARSRMIGG